MSVEQSSTISSRTHIVTTSTTIMKCVTVGGGSVTSLVEGTIDEETTVDEF